MRKRPPSSKKPFKILEHFKEIDRSFLTIVFLFLGFGLVIIYDSTAVLSQDIYGFAYRFVLLQLVWIALGLIAFFFFSLVELETLKKIATPLFVSTFVILFILGVFGLLPCSLDFMFAPCINGANRWFYLNPPPLPNLPLIGVLGFQPSELTKFSLIIFLSAALEKNLRRSDKDAFVAYILITGLTSFLIYLQPNLSTAVLVFLIGTFIYFASDADLKPLLLILPIVITLGFIFMISSEYRRDRIATFISGSEDPSDLSKGYHIRQILIALGSGGLMGLGFGQSRQKFQYLPEVFADSIFAIIGEELGFLGTTLLIILFAALIYKGYSISKKVNNLFGRLLAVGVTTWIGLQFFVNVAAMTRLIPLTGIPLPLISYGGSSLFFMLMGLGILANVSRKRVV